jgi:hypothetical protein
MEDADFGGFATKANLRCTDGRTIMPEAFKHQDKVKVPLVWAHGHNSADNVLGHAILEARGNDIYTWGFFNPETPQGRNAKALVKHKDIDRLSIWASELIEKSKQVFHGKIKEVSLVLAGANPGAIIDHVRVQHGDDPNDVEVLDAEAIIHSGESIDFIAEPDGVEEEEAVQHSASNPTIREIYNAWSQQDKDVLHFMVAAALEAAQDGQLAQSDNNNQGDLEHEDEEGKGEVKHNVFDQNQAGSDGQTGDFKLTTDHVREIFHAAQKGGNFMEAVSDFAIAHGIDSVESLFPDAKSLTDRPGWIKRRSEWVDKVLNGTRHLPFAKVKNMLADLTLDEARAKGYVTGEFKKEQWFLVSQRTTSPTTVYKKQRMDRDTLLDITDFDVVAWMWEEMRFMLKEELARAILLGDGRAVDDPDKIKDPEGATDGVGIRSILHEHHVYTTTLTLNLGDANSSYEEIVEELLRMRSQYKGTGSPDFYCTYATLAEMILAKDTLGHRLYPTKEAVAAALGVNEVIPVEVMEETAYANVLGIFVNVSDYSVGTNRGGEITTFDDFNIDYNKYTYLIETRLSGALTAYKSAVIVMRSGDAATLVVPNAPTFVKATGVVTIVATTGVVYKNDATGATLSTGAQTAIAAGDYVVIRAEAASSSYYLRTGPKTWTFKRDAA